MVLNIKNSIYMIKANKTAFSIKSYCAMTTLSSLLAGLFLLQSIQANASSSLNKTEENSRIVGGIATTIGRAKFVVNLRKKGKFVCGGSLVTPRFVVTAAHCVEGLKASELTVVAGATYLSDRGTRLGVSKIFVPKEYDPDNINMDVAVMELAGNMRGPNISTIELCKSKWKTNDIITVYGWGQTSDNADENSNQLRTVSVPIIDHTKCSNWYKGQGKITRSMFCAGNLKGKDACTGDSGGPAIYRNQLCGVVSWGIGCASKKYPGIYTNIIFVKPFIDKVLYRRGN